MGYWKNGRSKGWDRTIKHLVKEYESLFERLTELRERLERDSGQDVSAVDIEKAAYVLRKKALQSPGNFSSNIEDAEDDKALRPPAPKGREKRPEILKR